MSKAVIISYFYPPCNLTAAQRVRSFAEYLPLHDIKPIIISRNWDQPIRQQKDLSMPSGTTLKTVNTDSATIHYLPFRGSYRDRFLTRFGEERYTLVRKFMTFFEITLECLGYFSKDKRLIYQKAKKVIEEEQPSYLIISGNPFWQFNFGYRLKLKYPQLKWVADYRDDWTTGELGKKQDVLHRSLNNMTKKCERKWLKPADLITSVSEVLSNRIGKFNGKPATTIANGFFEGQFPQPKTADPKSFTVSYTGYLYPEQYVEWFLEAFKRLIDKHRKEVKLTVQFIGSAYEKKAAERINRLMKGYEEHLVLTNRVSRETCLEMEAKSDLLLMVSYRNMKGIPGSKLYQYLGSKKPIFLCPSDNDIVESTVEETGLGIICKDEHEAFVKLDHLLERHKNGKPLIENINHEKIANYSRRKQVEKLALTLKQL